MRYRIELSPAAERDLDALPDDVYRRIRPRIDALASNPRPQGVKKLRGTENLYRIRIGDYRVVYQVGDKVLRVLIVRVKHRRDAYRGEL